MIVYYFGCGKHEAGHYWHKPGAVGIMRRPPGCPWGNDIDGGLAPSFAIWRARGRREAPQGQALVAHAGGWTALAYWDRSMDSRPGSNSAFAAEGDYSFDELLTAAKEQWPWVFERQRFEVVSFLKEPPQ